MGYTEEQKALIKHMKEKGFEFVGFVDGVMQFNAITESDEWTDEDWEEFEKECE